MSGNEKKPELSIPKPVLLFFRTILKIIPTRWMKKFMVEAMKAAMQEIGPKIKSQLQEDEYSAAAILSIGTINGEPDFVFSLKTLKVVDGKICHSRDLQEPIQVIKMIQEADPDKAVKELGTKIKELKAQEVEDNDTKRLN